MFATGAAGLVAAAVGLQAYMTFGLLNQVAALERSKVAERDADYQWMARNLPAGANVLSNDDPLLYLASGHRGKWMMLMPRWWYADDKESVVNAYKNAVPYCRKGGLDYLYSTPDDLARFTEGRDIDRVLAAVRSDSRLKPVLTDSAGTLYRVSP